MSGLIGRRHPSSLKWCLTYWDVLNKIDENNHAIEVLDEARIDSEILQNTIIQSLAPRKAQGYKLEPND